jgi:hypothetical protein
VILLLSLPLILPRSTGQRSFPDSGAPRTSKLMTMPSWRAGLMGGRHSPRWREDDVRVRCGGRSDTSAGKKMLAEPEHYDHASCSGRLRSVWLGDGWNAVKDRVA